VDNFREDATGQRAFEIVFTAPIDQVERDWRQWVIGQPKVDLVIDADDAALGIRTAEKGANDGVLVTDVLPRSAASIGGLRRRDIVVSIDGRPTRSTSELRRIVASHKVGDVVDVKVRRGDEYFTATLTLRSLSAGM
jgi:S1-C subfamily serine protease